MATSASTTASRIRKAAAQLFAAHGAQAVGIRQIADAVGVSVSSLYNHIGTKEELLFNIMCDTMADLLAPAQPFLAADLAPQKRLQLIVRSHVALHAKDPVSAIVTDTELRTLGDARRRDIIRLRDQYQQIWVEVISQGEKQGVFKTEDKWLTAYALIEMCNGVAHWYSPGGRLSLEAVADRFVTMAFRLVGAGPPGPVPAQSTPGRAAGSNRDPGPVTGPDDAHLRSSSSAEGKDAAGSTA